MLVAQRACPSLERAAWANCGFPIHDRLRPNTGAAAGDMHRLVNATMLFLLRGSSPLASIPSLSARQPSRTPALAHRHRAACAVATERAQGDRARQGVWRDNQSRRLHPAEARRLRARYAPACEALCIWCAVVQATRNQQRIITAPCCALISATTSDRCTPRRPSTHLSAAGRAS